MASRKIKFGWKAVRCDMTRPTVVAGRAAPTLRFLYHSHNGRTAIPTGLWLEAKAKWVYNPGKKKTGTAYRAGFQYLASRIAVERFNTLTKGKYSFIRVRVRQVWRKPTKGSKSMMARFLFVPHFYDAVFY